eukprot:1161114-Pelagomonas_calceolata.AAC.8
MQQRVMDASPRKNLTGHSLNHFTVFRTCLTNDPADESYKGALAQVWERSRRQRGARLHIAQSGGG